MSNYIFTEEFKNTETFIIWKTESDAYPNVDLTYKNSYEDAVDHVVNDLIVRDFDDKTSDFDSLRDAAEHEVVEYSAAEIMNCIDDGWPIELDFVELVRRQ